MAFFPSLTIVVVSMSAQFTMIDSPNRGYATELECVARINQAVAKLGQLGVPFRIVTAKCEQRR